MSYTGTRLLLGLLAFVLIGWGVGELLLSVLASADLNDVRDIAAERSGTVIQAARVVTWAGSAFLLVPLALIICLVLGRVGLPREALAVIFSLGGAMLITVLVKLLVARPRPPVEHLQAVTSWSFPSGHATQASAFWFSLVFAMPSAASPKLTRMAAGVTLLIVLAVAASRVYLGVHYPSDVVIGLLLGIGWAIYVSLCLQEPERLSQSTQAR